MAWAINQDRSSKAEDPVNDLPLMEPEPGNIVLFHPHVPKSAFQKVEQVLKTRWIGQGPMVEAFEHDVFRR